MTRAALGIAALLSTTACGVFECGPGADCANPDSPFDSGGSGCFVEQETGVYGAVLWLEGNHGPGDGTGGEEWGLETTVAAFSPVEEATDVSSVEEYGRFDLGDAEPLASVESTDDGCYGMELDPGRYSVFAEDGDAWFCNSFSPDGLCVIELSEGENLPYTIEVDYMAAY